MFSKDLMQRVAEEGSVKNIDEFPEQMKHAFVTAHDVEPIWHVKIQAAFQKYTDNAVSKTVNMPNASTIEDVEEIYMMAYDTRCKGITIYRDGSRDKQVLNLVKKKEEVKA